MNKIQLIEVIKKMVDVISENKLYLSELDTYVGDGDHGINMARGFNAIKEHLNSYNDLSLSDILKDVYKTLMNVSAGTSGPLYGLLFKALANACAQKEEVGINELIEGMENGINKIMAIGGASLEDKTMLDAMIPCLNTLKYNGNIVDALESAKKGLEHTSELIARKGRASYVQERAVGHLDPGAASFCMLFECLLK